jgi:hypothetical protein
MTNITDIEAAHILCKISQKPFLLPTNIHPSTEETEPYCCYLSPREPSPHISATPSPEFTFPRSKYAVERIPWGFTEYFTFDDSDVPDTRSDDDSDIPDDESYYDIDIPHFKNNGDTDIRCTESRDDTVILCSETVDDAGVRANESDDDSDILHSDSGYDTELEDAYTSDGSDISDTSDMEWD